MPKLPVVTPKKFIRVLKNLGFFLLRQKGSHAFYIHNDGRKVVVPMHSKDIPNGTLMGMVRDIRLTKEELLELL